MTTSWTRRVRTAALRWILGTCALAVALVPALAAVPASATNSPGQPSGQPLVLGNVGEYQQPGFNGEPVGRDAIEAWAKWVNSHGGINGHPVQLIVRDNHGDQAQAVSLVKDLVENQHVVAFVSNQDGSLNAGYADYLNQKRIPVLGGSVFTPDPWVSNPMFFPQGLTALPDISSLIDTAKAAGYKQIGSIACAEAVQCSGANTLLESLSKKSGLGYVYGGVISSTAPDYTATCLAAKDKNAQALVLLLATADTGSKLVNDCARQGYHPSVILPGEAIGAGYLKTTSFNHALNNSPVEPWFSTDKSMSDFNTAMNKYAKNVNLNHADLPLAAVDAWVSGLMLQRAVQLSGTTGLPTTTDILAGLAKFQNETLGGMTGGLTFANPTSKDQYCYFTIEIKSQKFTLPNGITPKCVVPS
jgi:branched-chain amino acid transport system substrate-binding protein